MRRQIVPDIDCQSIQSVNLLSENDVADFEARKIVKEFGSANGSLRILDAVSVELNRGQSLAVLGPSGSGKSTFLHIAGTLDAPTSGSMILDGQQYGVFKETQLAMFRNQNIGFVFQEHLLLPQLSAFENVLIPTIASGTVDADSQRRAKELLERVGLADRMDHRPGMLSGGERQRVAVARSLICDPVLVLADEPTGSLDQKNAETIGNLLLELQASSQTILICVTHSEKLAALFDQRVELENGKFVKV